jgi:hypothetical protein
MQRICDERGASPFPIHNTCDGEVNTLVMDEPDSTPGMSSPKGPLLWQKRFASLFRQLVEARGGKRKISEVGRIFGFSQGYSSGIYSGNRNIGHIKFDSAKRKFQMLKEFYEEESLGEDPDYREWVKPKQGAPQQMATIAPADESLFSPFRILTEQNVKPSELDELAKLDPTDLQTPGQVTTALKVMRQMTQRGAKRDRAIEAAASGAKTFGAAERGEKLGGHRREKARPRPKKTRRTKKKSSDDQ